MNTFFDESGALNLDDLIMNQPSFQRIMADGVVTEEEIEEQGQRVKKLLLEMEQSLSPEHIDQVRELLAEVSVLITTGAIYDTQNK